MPDQATTEGSIVGYLRLDISDWNQKLDQAEAKARELGRLDPDVRVSADTGEAIAKLDAVAAAARAAGADHVSTVTTVSTSVGDSGDSSGTVGRTVATDALTVAIGRLDAAMAGLDAAQAADDEEMRQGSIQALKESLNMEALAGADRKAAAAAVEKAAAEETDAASTDRAATANKGNASSMGLMVAGVAALIPMLAPLSGYAVGVGGALAGMGASGVLAILGIKNEMKDATVEGQSYSAGLQTLKNDLNGLESTSANTMLAYFQHAVDQIDQAMPSLNGEIGLFSSQLGIVGNSVLRGVITGMQVLNPLFVAGGNYVERLAAGFASWTEDGGLQKFANYAMQVLPQVEGTLGSMANAIMHVVDATAPLGTVTLSILKTISDTLNRMDPTVLLDLAAGAGSAFLAFKAWAVLAPILAGVAKAVGAVGVATSIAEGPIGAVSATVAAFAAILAVNAVSAKQATTATNDYTAALEEDNGVIGENVRQQAAKALADSGAIKAGRLLGISATLITAATLNQGDAQQKLTARLKEVKDATDKAANGVYTEKLEKQFEAVQTVTGAVKDNSTALKSNMQTVKDEAAALAGQKLTQDGMATALGITAQAYATMTQKESAATTAANSLKTALDLLNGKNLSAAEAQNAFDSALANSNAHLNAAGTAIDATKTSLDGMSTAAVANRGELLQQTQAAENAAQAFRDQGGSATDTKQKLIDMKKAIIDNAVAHGEDRDAVQAFIDKVYQIPASIPPTTIEVNDAAAVQKLNNLLALYAQLDATAAAAGTSQKQNRTSGVVPLAPFQGPTYHANGGFIAQYRAAGGMVDAAYLAAGGSPFVPQGTDTVPIMGTPGEFMVKRASAQAYPGFLPAYNDNPTRALQAVAASGQQQTVVSLKGATILMSVDGRQMTAVIQDQIVSHANQRKMALSAGRQAGTL